MSPDYASPFQRALTDAARSAAERSAAQRRRGPAYLMARAEIQHEAKKDPRVGSQLVDELLDHWWSRRFDPPQVALDGATQALELVESIADA